MVVVTYEALFAYLNRLGFQDVSRSDFERVFEHSERRMILAFSMLDDASVDRVVRDADLLSVEFRLQHAGLLAGTLIDSETLFADS